MPGPTSPLPDHDFTRSGLFREINSVEDAAGREKAWREFYDQYVPIITAYVRKRGASRHVDEVVQTVLVSFLSASAGYRYDREKGRFRSYLWQCSRNALIKLLKAEAARSTVDIESIPEVPEREDQILFDAEVARERLRRAAEMVEQQYSGESRRRTFLAWKMNVIDNLPAPQVAHLLSMPVASVHTAKKRISDAVREKARAIDDEEG